MKTSLLYILGSIIRILPETRCFATKRLLLRICGVEVGTNVRICSSAKILGNGHLVIGDNTWIGHDTMIVSTSSVIIGENVNIAPRCYIGTGTHEISPTDQSIAGEGVSLPISIGSGSWICVNSVILAGSHIGKKAIVAAGAVVNTDVKDLEMVGGVPAEHIKFL